MTRVRAYAFWNLNIGIKLQEKDFGLPALRHLHKFESNRTPDMLFDVHMHEIDEAIINQKPSAASRIWRFYDNGTKRSFYSAIRKGQQLLIDFLYSYSSESTHGHIYTRTYQHNIPISPLHSLPLGLFLTDVFSARNGLFLHCTAITHQDSTYIFTGFSEAGKSTIANLWLQVPGVEVISDERVLLCEKDGRIWAYGTPWMSSAGQSSPNGAPLQKIFIIHHGQANLAVPLRPAAASAQLYARAYPAVWDPTRLAANVEFLNQIVTSVPCYDFGFIPDMTAIDYLLCHRP